MKEEKIYEQKCCCSNCEHDWVDSFVFGSSVPVLITCPNCGCNKGRTYGKPDNPEITYN